MIINQKPNSIEDYFSRFSPEIREKLQLIRDTLIKAVPECSEVISYQIPAIKTSDVFVYYAAQKKHIGYYPTNQLIIEFKKETARYIISKGAIQIPYDQGLPLKLIRDIAIFRKEQAMIKAENKKK